MLKLGEAVIEVGDVVRCDSDGREGHVIALDDAAEVVHVKLHRDVLIPDGETRILAVTDIHYNHWDKKFNDSRKPVTNCLQPSFDV